MIRVAGLLGIEADRIPSAYCLSVITRRPVVCHNILAFLDETMSSRCFLHQTLSLQRNIMTSGKTGPCWHPTMMALAPVDFTPLGRLTKIKYNYRVYSCLPDTIKDGYQILYTGSSLSWYTDIPHAFASLSRMFMFSRSMAESIGKMIRIARCFLRWFPWLNWFPASII